MPRQPALRVLLLALLAPLLLAPIPARAQPPPSGQDSLPNVTAAAAGPSEYSEGLQTLKAQFQPVADDSEHLERSLPGGLRDKLRGGFTRPLKGEGGVPNAYRTSGLGFGSGCFWSIRPFSLPLSAGKQARPVGSVGMPLLPKTRTGCFGEGGRSTDAPTSVPPPPHQPSARAR
jgi:hypothetical protein